MLCAIIGIVIVVASDAASTYSVAVSKIRKSLYNNY